MELTAEQREVLDYLIELTAPSDRGGNLVVAVEQVVSQSNLDANQVRDALIQLETMGRIDIQNDTADTIVRIC
jgi:hypothetical protein